MANIKTIKTSSPNDGLGDTLRDSQVKANENFAELNTKKVEKVVGKELSSNNLTDELVEKINSIEDLAEQNVQSDWEQDDDTQTDFIKNKPPELLSSVGYFDYNDLATQTTPITVIGGGGETLLTNDALGSNTNIDQAPYGVDTIWDPLTNSFDFSDLSIGDMIDIRLDLKVTTTLTNTQISVDLHLGDAYPFETPFIVPFNNKDTVTDAEVIRYNGIYIGSDDMIAGGGQFFATSDKDCEFTVVGWYCKVIRKSVNIIDISEKENLSEFNNNGNGSTGDEFVNLNTPQTIEALKSFKNEIRLDGTDFETVKISDQNGVEILRKDTLNDVISLADGDVEIEGELLRLPNSTVNLIANGGDKVAITKEYLESNIPNLDGLIEITYDNLTTLISANELVKGQVYLLTDYMTTYIQPVTGATKSSGVIEPLYITATDVDKLSNIAYSQLYPQDIVYYEVTGVLDGDDNTYGVGDEGFIKGKIYRRIDTQRNNDIGTDWRHVKYDRDGVDKLLFEDYTGCVNNVIKTYYLFDTVVGHTFSGNTIDDYFESNTIGIFASENKIGDSFATNIVGDNFSSNVISNGVEENTIGNAFYSNEISSFFYLNTIPDNIQNNQFTVLTLPTGGVSTGQEFIVTDALNPSFLTTLTGGGDVVCPVLYDGAKWVATVEGITLNKRITNATVTGSYNLDHSLADAWILTLTGDTTITDSNFPTNDSTRNFTVKVTGDFNLTVPSYWGTPTGDTYNGEQWNYYTIQVENGNVGSEDLTVFLSNLS